MTYWEWGSRNSETRVDSPQPNFRAAIAVVTSGKFSIGSEIKTVVSPYDYIFVCFIIVIIFFCVPTSISATYSKRVYSPKKNNTNNKKLSPNKLLTNDVILFFPFERSSLTFYSMVKKVFYII